MSRCAVVLVFCLTIQAYAEDRDESLRISRAEFERHVQELDLAPHQKQAAEAVYLASTNEFNDAMKAQQALNAWLWTNTSSHGWYGGESPKPFYEHVTRDSRELDIRWQRGARELEQKYFEDLSRIAIGAEQMIASFERRHRRDRILVGNTGLPTGAACDLVELIADLKLDPDASPDIAKILGEYEQVLDRLLRQFEDNSITSQVRRDEARAQLQLARDSEDKEAIEKAAETLAHTVSSGIAIGFEIWQLQQQTADRLVAGLEGQHKLRFRDLIAEHVDTFAYQVDPFGHQKSKPSIERIMESALRDKSISDESKVEIERLRLRYVALREQKMPGLRILYSSVIAPAAMREGFRLSLIGDRQRVNDHWQPILEPWETAHRIWLAECDSIRNQLERLRVEAKAAP